MFATLWTPGTSDVTFGLLTAGDGLADGGLRIEYGNWKVDGDYFFPEYIDGIHFHFGEGLGLQSHHLPWQLGNWLRNLNSLIGRGKAGADLLNLGKVAAGLTSLGIRPLSNGGCECDQ
jgi:hypothetical protein